MNPGVHADLVHGPLAQWAFSRGDAVAIRSAARTVTFSQLHAAVTRRAADLALAPSIVVVDATLPMADRLVDFLGIVASGRCAAVGDPDWPVSVRDAVRASLPTHPAPATSATPQSPFYLGYTSGSTGQPKGYLRHHASWTSSFRACQDAFGAHASDCVLAAGRDAHSLFLFGMLLGLWTGGGVVVQEQFSALRALEVLRQRRASCLIAVPSQLIMMVEVAKRRQLAPVQGVNLILISGSRWIRARTDELRALFPGARIVEFYGASETSFVAWMDTDTAAPIPVVGRPFDQVSVQIRDPDPVTGVGLIYVRSPMLFMGYVGGPTDETAALRDGDWLSVRDLGYVDASGYLCLTGRQSRMVVTKGKNLFPEEVEAVLEAHPSIADASVHGVDDALRGRVVVAVIKTKDTPDCAAVSALQLTHWCQQHLEPYKAPRQYWVCQDWPLTPAAKPDHRALGQALACLGRNTTDPCLPCLRLLP